jgi:hypothetical protein
MKTVSQELLFSVLLCCLLFAGHSSLAAGTNFFSTYPNNGSPGASDLFIMQQTDGTTFNLTRAQLPDAIGLGTAAFTASGAYDTAGAGTTAATAATNGLGGAAFKNTNTFDLAGTAVAVTNGFPWGALYDPLGRAVSVTNGFPWGVLYDAAGAATAATNGLATSAFGNATGLTTGTLPPAVLPSFDITNNWQGTFTSIGGIFSGGLTNSALSASSLAKTDANKKLTSLANGVGALTNDASGNFGYAPLLDASALKASQYVATDANTNLVSTQNGNNWTNTIPWTHEGTTTNITLTFNGTLQQFTCTNGPSIGQQYFFHFAGANGSVSIRFVGSSFNNLNWDYQPTWLAGSNSVVTNGVLTITSYGGTNAAQLVAAMKEKQ